jgi:PKD repeat protein
MRFPLLLLLALCLGCSLTQAQPCVYMAYEPFQYPAGIALHSLEGGGGWTSAWMVQNDDSVIPGYQIDNTTSSLQYGSLLTNGNHASGGRAYLTAWRLLNATHEGTFGPYVEAWQSGIGTLAQGDTLWVSSVMQINGNGDHEIKLDLFEAAGFWCPECTRLSIGYFGSPSNVGGQRRWSMESDGTVFTSDVVVETGQPALHVLRLIFNPGATQIDYYINPIGLGGTPPTTAALSHTTSEALIIRSLILYMDQQPGSVSIDEIRFADSYRCVAPDMSTPVDLPPVAAFSIDPPAGMVPLTVTVDATASVDPEGGPLRYLWDFGDGMGVMEGNAIMQRTFSSLVGQLNVRLTVIDISGQENTAVRTVTLYNASGTFPCQVSVACLSMASCEGSGGALRVDTHAHLADFALYNGAGSSQPVEDGNHFRHLDPGPYTLVTNGPNGCRDTFYLDIRVDSTTCPGWSPEACAMDVGTNLGGFADWSPERPLRNRFKHIRSDLIPYTDDCQCWSLDHVLDQIAVDADGYPTHIPQSTSEGATRVRFFLNAESGNVLPGSHMVMRYDGEGTIEMQGGINVLSSMPGRIEFVSTGDFWMHLTTSTPGNHVRNIRMTLLEDENADLQNNPFYDGFLEKIQPFHSLRFMDWGHTNNNPIVHWEDRTSLTSFTYAGERGVPYEIMIQLSNQTQKDPWICVPHAADENYIRQMARLFRDQLDPGLTIYLEYSNEVWNWIFDQAHYNEAHRPGNLHYGQAYAEKSGRVFRIWHEEFGPQKDRVKRVLGIQAGFNWLNEQILAQLPQDAWDYGSPTHYVGLRHGNDGVPVLHAGSTPEDVLQNAWNNFLEEKAYVRGDYRTIQAYGKEVITYEGGQHFVGNVFGIPYDYQEAMWEAQYHPGMYDLYIHLHDSIRHWGCALASNFSLAGPQESVFGSWGVLSHIDMQPPFFDSAPKYQALLDIICARDPTSVTPELPSYTEALKVWPNPHRGWFTYELASPSPVRLLTIHDLFGRQVWQGGTAAQVIEALLPAGYYLFTVWTEAGRHTHTMIITE